MKLPLPDISYWPIVLDEGGVIILLGVGWAWYYLLRRFGRVII